MQLGVALAIAAVTPCDCLIASAASTCRSSSGWQSALPRAHFKGGRTVHLAAVNDDAADLPLVSLNQRRSPSANAKAGSGFDKRTAGLPQQQKDLISELGVDDGTVFNEVSLKKVLAGLDAAAESESRQRAADEEQQRELKRLRESMVSNAKSNKSNAITAVPVLQDRSSTAANRIALRSR
eukprot:7068-Heterococcus_DN1.PRE.1